MFNTKYMGIALESKKQYFNLIDPKYITWNFYEQYINVEPNFGELGLVVYLRTYSRFIEELNRREKWCETVLRVVEYSISLDTRQHLAAKTEEAEKLFDALFNLKVFAAGRSYWVSGSKQSCNLTSTNPYYHINKNNEFEWITWINSLKLATRMGSRMFQWHPEWDTTQKSQRLLGVSITGLMDVVDRLNWNTEDLQRFLNISAEVVREEADRYHDELGIERSARVTLLPRFDPVEGGKALYPNMPYEPCLMSEYQQLKDKLPELKEEDLIKLLSNYESNFEEQKLDSSCDSGSCPVRKG